MDFSLILVVVGAIAFVGYLVWLIVRSLNWDSKIPPIIGMLLCVVMIVGGLSTMEGINNLIKPDEKGKSQESPNDVGEIREEEKQEKQNQLKDEIIFDRLSVVDNEECSIIITGLNPDSLWGYTVIANFENKSSDITYMFSVESAAVNGIQCDPFFASEVVPGKKSVANISFSNSVLKDNDIDFSDIELTFRVYDTNDWTADEVARETMHIYPFGEERAKNFVRSPQKSDEILADDNGVTATVIGYNPDSIWGYTVELYLQNNTDKEVMFSVDEASINGYMADPFWASSVLPGKCEFSSMSWSNSTLEEIGVTDINRIEFSLRVYDSNNWTGEDFVNTTITLNP